MPEEGGAVFPLILSNPPPVYDASFGFLLYWKRPSERYFQTAFCLFLRKFCTAAAGEKTVFPLCQTAVFSVACLKLRPNGLVWMPKFCVSRCLKWFGSLERYFPRRIGCRCGRRCFQTAVSVCLVGRKAFISLSFFYGASRLGTAITATICAVSCYNPPALPIRPSEAHFQTASTKEKTNHEPIPLARYRQSAVRPAPAG